MRATKHKYNCRSCGKESLGFKLQVLCSPECRKSFYDGEIKRHLTHLTSGTVGAIQELRVSVDLLKKGYHVFRALSPSCSCDLLALKDGVMIQFEVRTGYRRKNGNILYPKTNIKASHIVVALPEELIYIPEI